MQQYDGDAAWWIAQGFERVTDDAMRSGEALGDLVLGDVTGSYSPILLRYIPDPAARMEVASEGLSMVLHCARTTMDDMEFRAVLTMLQSAAERGRCSLMYSTRATDTGHLRWFPACHSIYYSASHPCYQDCVGRSYTPRTLAEGVMLCNYSWLRSIALT